MTQILENPILSNSINDLKGLQDGKIIPISKLTNLLYNINRNFEMISEYERETLKSMIDSLNILHKRENNQLLKTVLGEELSMLKTNLGSSLLQENEG